MKKIISHLLAVIFFSICIYICNSAWKYILNDDTSSWTRVMMHQLYTSPDNIDVIFVGSSHVYRSLIPSVTDEYFDKYTFNGGSGGQYMDASYALIREAAKSNKLEKIYLEVYYVIATGDDYSDRTQLTSTYIISDYMKPSFRKIGFLLKASSKEYWINSFCIARRNWTHFFEFDTIKDILIKKSTKDYKEYRLPSEGEQHYVDRGFVSNSLQYPQKTNNMAYGEISVDKLAGSDWEKSLNQIIEFCKKNNIELTLFVTPEPESTIIGKGNYQEYHDYIQKIASKHNIEFDDFNFCSNDYFDMTDESLFLDNEHTNTNGACEFSHLFGKVYGGGEIKKEDLFYDTLISKLESEEPTVYGVAGPSNDENSDIESFYIISNRNEGLKYRISVVPEKDEGYTIQDFDNNRFFQIPQNESGIILVEWVENDKDDIQSKEIPFD